MPLLTFKIEALTDAVTGTTDPLREYSFDALSGKPIPARYRIQDLERVGVDFHGVRKLGRTGPQFRMVSTEYTETLAAATEQLARYQQLMGDSVGVKITHKDLEYFPADVLLVDFDSAPYPVANVSGSLVANPTACLKCAWVFRLRNAEPVL